MQSFRRNVRVASMPFVLDYRRPLFSVAALLALGVAGAHPHRAEARRSAPPSVVGAYFGSVQEGPRNVWAGEMNIHFQNARRVAGTLRIERRYPAIAFTGRLSPSGRLTARGVGGVGPTTIRMRFSGRFRPTGEGTWMELRGRFTLSGQERARGTCLMLGDPGSTG